ncbi:MAG: DctP family TRAP transporter solute-binding subunit [Oscillospiraceae bacterium]|jgi:tripartite ATP-independent transporter DctP family solute receptor|nr:DctP family TRAP transporter solute-binding subunit [Oscillospiraceae bacterium]
MKKTLAIILALFVVAGSLVGCGSSGGSASSTATSQAPTAAATSSEAASAVDSGTNTETIELKFANVSSAVGAKGESIDMFANLVNERTNGRYNITVYHDGQLGNEISFVEDCQTGTLDIASVNFANLTNYIDAYGVFDLPYLVKSTEHADAIWMGEVGKYFLDMLGTVGLHAVANVELGFRDLSNSARAVNSAADIAGLRIRVMENAIHQEIFSAFGADPVAMNWNEAYTALQQGAIDGQDNPATHALDLNIIDVNKYLAMTDHVYNVAVFIMSDKLWQSMSAEDQALFEEIAQEVAVWERKAQRDTLETVVKAVNDAGGEVTYPDKEELFTLTQGVRDQYQEKYSEYIKLIEDCAP